MSVASADRINSAMSESISHKKSNTSRTSSFWKIFDILDFLAISITVFVKFQIFSKDLTLEEAQRIQDEFSNVDIQVIKQESKGKGPGVLEAINLCKYDLYIPAG